MGPSAVFVPFSCRKYQIYCVTPAFPCMVLPCPGPALHLLGSGQPCLVLPCPASAWFCPVLPCPARPYPACHNENHVHSTSWPFIVMLLQQGLKRLFIPGIRWTLELQPNAAPESRCIGCMLSFVAVLQQHNSEQRAGRLKVVFHCSTLSSSSSSAPKRGALC